MQTIMIFWSSWRLEMVVSERQQCLGRLGGVEEEEESEEESGEVPGLSALFSTCTSTDAYSVVSVRDFHYLFI